MCAEGDRFTLYGTQGLPDLLSPLQTSSIGVLAGDTEFSGIAP